MNMFLETRNEQEIFRLKGELKVHLIPEISPQLLKYITVNPGKGLILDMSAVDFIDSSTIRMLINLHKRLEPNKKKLCLLSPSVQVKKIIEDVKLNTVFTIYASSEELEREATDALRMAYREFTVERDGLKKLVCTCPVCGSSDVQGYIVDEAAYNWSWEKDSLFPQSLAKDSNTPCDVFSAMPIVCTNCYMSSLNFAHFNASAASGEEPPAIAARLSDIAKQHLSKSIKARKKMMESCVVIGDDFFNNPRNKIATYYCLRLAESCARVMATAKVPSSAFQIGYINYLTIPYAGQDAKEDLIGSIRTWMNQVVAEKESYRTLETAKAYFILFAAAFSLDKHKEAARILEEFSTFVGAQAAMAASSAAGVGSPHFWHSQALKIGEKLSSATF